MSSLTEKSCKPCEGGTAPLSTDMATDLISQLQPGWQLIEDGKALKREWKFKNFYRTMSFVNAIAHIANTEDHHPDLQVGYDYCRVRYSTHAIGGLSENDFICAAKVDALAQ
jgi:4a-hydroxytetrahydrobiopterin dehydratase